VLRALFGVCCLNSTRSDARQLVADPESPLHEYAANIVLVQDPIVNEISSTKVRGELAQARGPALSFSGAFGWLHKACCGHAHAHDPSMPYTHVQGLFQNP
jgi:hypothetical protein